MTISGVCFKVVSVLMAISRKIKGDFVMQSKAINYLSNSQFNLFQKNLFSFKEQ